MPSESNLMRIDYAARLFKANPESNVIVAHPHDSDVIRLMINELIVKGVDSAHILTEMHGTNTREQALSIAKYIPVSLNQNVVIVTSPENMLRTMLTFRKVGFNKIGGEPAFENPMFTDLSYNHKNIGGDAMMPDINTNLKLRYDFWNYMKLEITCLRELTALLYYKLNGWI